MKWLIASFVWWPMTALAQTLDLGGSPPPASTTTAAGQSCMTVTAGTSVAYGCIDAEQSALTRQHQATVAGTAPSQTTHAPSLGVFNQAATREHLGRSFGHSTVPQSAPPPKFGNPLPPH